MPAATVEVAKPEAPAKPAPTKPGAGKPKAKAGFTKPAGNAKKAAVAQELEEEEDKPTHPSILVCAGAAVLAMLVVLYFQYNIDQNMSRQSEPVLGWPTSGDEAAAEESEEAEPAEEEESEEEE